MCGEYLLPPLSKVRAVCGSTACTDLRGGRRGIGVPTATSCITCGFAQGLFSFFIRRAFLNRSCSAVFAAAALAEIIRVFGRAVLAGLASASGISIPSKFHDSPYATLKIFAGALDRT